MEMKPAATIHKEVDGVLTEHRTGSMAEVINGTSLDNLAKLTCNIALLTGKHFLVPSQNLPSFAK